MKEANALFNHRDTIFGFSSGDTVYTPDDIKENTILILHGGVDISPTLYKKKRSPRSGGGQIPTQRDQQEWDLITRAVELNVPIVGLCRGAQMLCAFDGGYLVQHINNHGGCSHTVIDKKTNMKYISNSCHHQMMVPSKHAVIIAESEYPTVGYDELDYAFEISSVPEVVYFPDIRALGIQSHPEWMGHHNIFVQYCKQLIETLLLRN